MFRTSKTFHFSAGHALDHLASGRQCARPHGHNYTVEVIMQARVLSSDSFVRDPIEYRRIQLFIRNALDRRNLNETFAAEFEDDIKHHLAIRVSIRRSPNEWLEASQEAIDAALVTTTENIARAIFLRLHADFPEIVAVRVGDTPDTWAEYSPDV